MATPAQPTFVRTWIPWAMVSIVLGCYAALQVWHFEEAFVFHGDHERDLRMVVGLVQHGEWPAATPTISPFPIQLGPLLYLFLAPIVALSADPFFVRGAFLILTLIGGGIFFQVLRRWVRWEAATFAVAALVASVFTFEMSRQLWHSSLLPIPIAGFFWSAFRLLQPSAAPRRPAIMGGVCAAIAVQLHAVGSIYGMLWLGLLWVRRKDLRWRGILVAGSAAILMLLPFLWTLVQTLQTTTAHPGSPMPSAWQPANFWTVLTFFMENLQPIWGDNFGPLMGWPWIALLLWGAVTAVRVRDRFALFLVANIALGWIVESLLLGNEPAHRYMHANLWGSFALMAFGVNALLTRRSHRWISSLMAVIVTIMVVEAWLSPLPHAGIQGWLNAREQRDVAQTVATKFPLTDAEMETRVHGVYFGELTGVGHFHSLYRDVNTASFSPSAHVMVMPSDIGLVPHGRLLDSAHMIKGPHRSIAVYAFEPFIDWANMQVSGPRKEALFQKWRRMTGKWYEQESNRGPTGEILESPNDAANAPKYHPEQGSIHRIILRVTQPGTVHVVLRSGRDVRDRCPLTASLDGELLSAQSVQTPLSLVRIQALEITKPGSVHLQVGPCRELTFFDLW